MTDEVGANAGRASAWLLREVVRQLHDRGLIDGSALHQRMLQMADDPEATAEQKAEFHLGAVLVESVSKHPPRS